MEYYQAAFCATVIGMILLCRVMMLTRDRWDVSLLMEIWGGESSKYFPDRTYTVLFKKHYCLTS
jgi:hypothetical protein